MVTQLDGDPAPAARKGTTAPLFVATVDHLSYC